MITCVDGIFCSTYLIARCHKAGSDAMPYGSRLYLKSPLWVSLFNTFCLNIQRGKNDPRVNIRRYTGIALYLSFESPFSGV